MQRIPRTGGCASGASVLSGHPSGSVEPTLTARVRGFTLIEVVVALAILGLAVVTIIQLFSQGLRLLKLSGDHQRAVLLADQKAREVEPANAGTESGQEGEFAWERRVEIVPVPEELTVLGVAPLRVFRVSVQVRWSGNRSVEVVTLRTAREVVAR